MDYTERIQRAIDYIELHLKEALSIYEIAKSACLSVAHLYRIFPAMAGCTVGGYIRRRRLTLSADELRSTGKRVIDIAYDYQFESQESFIRAFKSAFGITPGQYRRFKKMIPLYHALQLNSSQRIGAFAMQPDIIRKNFTLIGHKIEVDLCTDFSAAIDGAIAFLKQNLPHIGHIIEPARLIGLWYPEFYSSCADAEPKIMFFAGVEVTKTAEIPAGLVSKELPESLFAAFHEDQRGTIGGPEGYAYTAWLPTSGYTLNEDLPGDLELYQDMEHVGFSDACMILLPIRA